VNESRRWNFILLALVGGVVVLLGLLWFFGSNRNPDQDKLTNPQIEQARQVDSSQLCRNNDVYATIKQQLFASAAQVRGKDQDVLTRIAGAAVLRMENPVMEGEDPASHAVSCSGALSLDLPPGVAVTGGQRTLTADVDYTVQPGAGVQLRNADAIISSLATLEEVEETPADDMNMVDANAAEAEPATTATGAPSSYPGHPSFDCANAQTRGEVAVCSDPGLAALDVNMVKQYRHALTTASPSQLQLLQTTRTRFLGYRDACPDRTCIANAYLGRMREIRDIMEGRLTPNR
jgi:hypothetical protein